MKKGRFSIVWLIALIWIAGTSTAQLPLVKPVAWSAIRSDDFAPDELDMPYFLAHLSTVANAVVDTGQNKGYINIGVWRGRENNRTYNARILENVLSLAYFYSAKRHWNPYYGDPALRKRIEAVLEYWCGMQNSDGRFSEYAPKEWSLAATAFAAKFMGAALTLLKNGPSIDPAVFKRAIQADRKAIVAALTRDDLYTHGREYTNQYCNVWPGALSFMRLYPDPEIKALLQKRMRETAVDFQSPAGYFYERNGPDWSYNLVTQPTNLEAVKQYTADPTILNALLAEEKLFYDWLSYNALLEPDGSVFFLNCSVETRGRVPYIGRQPEGLFSRDALPAEQVELARPFCASREELDARRREARSRLEKEWPAVDELGEFTPYDFLGRDFPRWLPTDEERRAATAGLPYLARRRFIHQRTDSRFPVSFTFVKRPAYYAAFNSGEIVSESQRYGLGLVWNPVMGTVLQSQTASAEGAWGTVPGDSVNTLESRTFHPAFTIGGKAVNPKAGAFDLPDGTEGTQGTYGTDGKLSAEYALGKTGSKTIRFGEKGLQVKVRYAGGFTENIPLLVGKNDSLVLKSNRAELGRCIVWFDRKAKPGIREPVERRPFGRRAPGIKTVRILRLAARDSLSYELEFSE